MSTTGVGIVGFGSGSQADKIFRRSFLKIDGMVDVDVDVDVDVVVVDEDGDEVDLSICWLLISLGCAGGSCCWCC